MKLQRDRFHFKDVDKPRTFNHIYYKNIRVFVDARMLGWYTY